MDGEASLRVSSPAYCSPRPRYCYPLPGCCFLCVDSAIVLNVYVKVVFHYFVDRVLQVDSERVLCLLPVVRSRLTALAAVSSGGDVKTRAAFCSFLPRLCVQLSLAVRHTAAEMCRRRAEMIEPLLALLQDAVDAILTHLTPHATQLVWDAWQQCKSAMSDQHMHEQIDSIERSLQQRAQGGGAAMSHLR